MSGALGDVVSEYMERGLVLVIADLLSLITVSSCLVIKVPQINTIRANESSKGEHRPHKTITTIIPLMISMIPDQALAFWDYAWSCSAIR